MDATVGFYPGYSPQPHSLEPDLEREANPNYRAVVLLFGSVVVAAVLLRMRHLGEWSLSGDEFYTVLEGKAALAEDSTLAEDLRDHAQWARNANPLLQLVTVASFSMLGPTVLAARLFPLLAGLAALLVLPWLVHRWQGPRAAGVALLLLAFCPLHIEASCTARYQSMQFLFAGSALLSTLIWLDSGRRSYVVAAILCGVLTVASHVSGGLILGTLLLFLLLSGRLGWKGSGVLLLLVAVAAVVKLEECQHALQVIRRHNTLSNYRPSYLRLLLSQVYNLGPLLCLFAALGGILACRRSKPAGCLLLSTALLPCATLLALSTGFDVGVRYFASIHPAILLLAVLGVVALGRRWQDRGMFWLPALLVTSTQMPLVLSNQVDGQRYPFAEVAQRLSETATPEDLILADSHGILGYYADLPLQELPDWIERIEEATRGHPQRRATVVVQRQRGRIVSTREPEALEAWLELHSLHREDFGRRRPDDRLYCFELSLFQVELPPPLGPADTPEE